MADRPRSADKPYNLSLDQAPEVTVYRLLSSVLGGGAYSGIELNKILSENADDSPYITMLFYGVLEKSVQLDYVINKLCDKKPKPSVALLIKIGLYLMRYTDTPDYAAVNKTVELVKKLGKSGVSGFVNAVLKKSGSVILPSVKDAASLAVNASYPLWLVEMLISDYGFDFTSEMLMHDAFTDTHIRRNAFHIKHETFLQKYPFLSENSTQTGYYVTHRTLEKLSKDDYIIQGLASTLAVKYYFEPKAREIIDLCAAPGGKSVYLLEQYLGDAKPHIIACDIHPHRLELIKKYADGAGCGGEIDVVLNDAAKIRSDFIEKFDLVICDVPCSGIGVAGSKPDILLNKKAADIDKLSALQREILGVASRYVKRGGALVYSTCTLLTKENEAAVESFLQSNADFALEPFGYLKLFPHKDNCDGFFAAKLRKI